MELVSYKYTEPPVILPENQIAISIYHYDVVGFPVYSHLFDYIQVVHVKCGTRIVQVFHCVGQNGSTKLFHCI